MYVQLNVFDRWNQEKSEKQILSLELSYLGLGILFLSVRAHFLCFFRTPHLMHCDANLLTCFFFGWQGKNAKIQIVPFITPVLIQNNAVKVRAIPSEQLRCSWKQNLAWGLFKTQSGPGAQKYNTNQRKYKMIYPEICSLKVDSISPDAGCRKGMCDFHISTVLISSSVQQLVRLKSWPVGNCCCFRAQSQAAGKEPFQQGQAPKACPRCLYQP